MDAKRGEFIFLARLSKQKFKWARRSTTIWDAINGMIINLWGGEYYLYLSQDDFDKGVSVFEDKSLESVKIYAIWCCSEVNNE